jgi:CRP-like cAMP-binding protein
MPTGELGKTYQGGEAIIREGETGNCMYVIQEGEVEVVSVRGEEIIRLAVLKRGDFFGETALFAEETRTATVRALGPTRVITVDKKTLLSRIEEDPSLAFRMIETLSRRVHRMSQEVVGIKSHTFDH